MRQHATVKKYESMVDLYDALELKVLDGSIGLGDSLAELEDLDRTRLEEYWSIGHRTELRLDSAKVAYLIMKDTKWV